MAAFILPLALSIFCLGNVCQSKPVAPIAVPIQVQQTNKSLDPPVLEVVLQDIFADKFLNDGEETLLFNPDAMMPPIALKELLRQDATDPKAWNRLTLDDIIAIREAAKHVLARVKAKDGIQPFAPANKKIHLVEKKKLSKGSEKQKRGDALGDTYRRAVYAYPPGYTADRQYAFVRLSVPWSIHHAGVTYFLARRKGQWIILLRQSIVYL